MKPIRSLVEVAWPRSETVANSHGFELRQLCRKRDPLQLHIQLCVEEREFSAANPVIEAPSKTGCPQTRWKLQLLHSVPIQLQSASSSRVPRTVHQS